MVNDVSRYPNNNWDLMENNEVGANAWGGTEMYMSFIYNGGVPRELLENVQIIPSRLREMKEDKIRVWFEHNLPNDPESQKALATDEMRRKFHKVIFLSNWQYQQFMNYVGVPFSTQNMVIEGGFEVADGPFPDKPDVNDVVNICYHTTPHRGLEILVPAFQHLADTDKKIHLHVHSSFKMYGWDSRDEQYEQIYKVCREHPQITYHGYTEYYKLRELLQNKYHIYAYPNIWPETMCRSVLEAMHFGLVVVCPNLAAIPDTTGCVNPFMYPGCMDKQEHAGLHASVLKQAIDSMRNNNDAIKNILFFNRLYILNRYNSPTVHGKWAGMLADLNNRYPTVESRAFPKDQVVFKY